MSNEISYVTSAWYVAGWSRDFTTGLVPVTMLDENIVIYRTSTGKPVALEDRCPHKLLPLSKGKIIDDAIQCGYHGMTFDCTGQCVRVPGQDYVPPSAKVRSYPVHESHGIVWLWMGKADEADPSKVFHLAQFDDPAWEMHLGDALHLKSNYLNVAENLVDPAHVSFVHPTTLGNAQSEDVPVEVDTRGDVIVAHRWIRNAPPIGFFKEFGGFTGNVDRWHYYYLHLPCTAVIDFGSADSALGLKEDERGRGVRIFAVHLMTPVTATYTIDRWLHVRNTATGTPGVAEKMDALFRVAFAEDKEILEAIQREELRGTPAHPVRLAIDRGSNVFRSRINKLIAAETRSGSRSTEAGQQEGRA